MKKRPVTKGLLRRLQGKKQQRVVETLEKRLKSTLLEHAQVPEQWLWLGDIKRAGYMMEQVLETLAGEKIDDELTGTTSGAGRAVA